MTSRKEIARLALLKAEQSRGKARVLATEPIDPIDASCDVFGCEVVFKALPSLEGIYSTEPRPTIVIGSERPYGRQYFTCAHELGHHVFGHGTSLDELEADFSACSDEEYAANVFASYFLVSKLAFLAAIKERGFRVAEISPWQMFKLAHYFGVGYSTIINHACYALEVITATQRKHLLGYQPKSFKEVMQIPTSSDVFVADYHWKKKALNACVGDYILLPSDCEVSDNGERILYIDQYDNLARFKVVSPGYARALSMENDWGINIRLSKKCYEGFAQYRFLEDE